MTEITSIEALYGIGSVLLTMAVLAPVIFADPTGRSGSFASFLGDRVRHAARRRLPDAALSRPDPDHSGNASFALNLEFGVSGIDRSVIDADSLKDATFVVA